MYTILDHSPALYQPSTPRNYDVLGTLKTDNGRTGALCRHKKTGIYVLFNAGASSSLDQSAAMSALIAHNLVKHRTAQGLKKRELADKADVADRTIRIIEAQEMQPTVGMLQKLAIALGISRSDLLP